ncbi:MAG: transketolase [Chloroflexi bacterium]|nr:transketolase [Chloroflexota bacterium]
MSDAELQHLASLANKVRQHVVRMTANSGVGHQGGPLSAAEILVTLYFYALRIDPGRPGWEERDRFILSKGHAASGFYATLAERGFFPVDELTTFGFINSRLQLHPDVHLLPGVEASTGSLGQGLSIGIGIALGARMDGRLFRTYVLISDGESQEGQIWEAAMAAGNWHLSNLTAILDYNGVQQCGRVDQQMSLEPVAAKWRAFGWDVLEVDGHEVGALTEALDAARQPKECPTIIVAHTVKGKGVSFMEGNFEWHSKPLSAELARQALTELGAR